MRYIALCLSLSVLMSCAEEQKTPELNIDSIATADSLAKVDSIRKIDSALEAKRVADSIANDTVAAAVTLPVNFTVWYSSSYCGGARPSDEMLAEYEREKLLTSSTLKLKNHHTGKEYLLTTNNAGIGTLDAEEGKYDVFLTKSINSSLATGFDPNCSMWMDQLLCTVKVLAGKSKGDIHIAFVCNPCDHGMRP